MYYIYILKCADDSYYVGFTTNLISRMKQHNESEQVSRMNSRAVDSSDNGEPAVNCSITLNSKLSLLILILSL